MVKKQFEPSQKHMPNFNLGTRFIILIWNSRLSPLYQSSDLVFPPSRITPQVTSLFHFHLRVIVIWLVRPGKSHTFPQVTRCMKLIQ